MRSLILVFGGISILGLASVHATYAQTDGKSSRPSEANIQQQHPEWFEPKGVYRPCPASVAFPDGRSACLGCPTRCRFHF